MLESQTLRDIVRPPAGLHLSRFSLTAHHDHVGFDHHPVDHDSLRAFNRVVRPMGADSPNRPATDSEWVKIRKNLDSLRAIRPPRISRHFSLTFRLSSAVGTRC